MKVNDFLDFPVPEPQYKIPITKSAEEPKNYPNFFKTDDTGPDLASVGNRSVDCGEANAYLIAAAPDLYEALSDILKRGLSIDAIENASAALARARGETP